MKIEKINRILNEDYDRNRIPPYPVKTLSRSEVLRAAAHVKRGGFISMGYIKPVSLQARFVNGEDKRTHEQFPIVRVIKLLEDSGVTGISYGELKAVKEKNAQTASEVVDAISDLTPQEVREDKPATNWIVKNIIEEHPNGNWQVDYYPLRRRAYKRYYISIDGEDYRETVADEIKQYMTPSGYAKEFEHVYNDEDQGTYSKGSVNFNYRTVDRIYKFDKMGDLVIKKDTTKNKLERDPEESEVSNEREGTDNEN